MDIDHIREKIMLVVGTRPNIVKMAPLYHELRRHPHIFHPVVVHTGQHHDHLMCGRFFSDLELPSPDILIPPLTGASREERMRSMVTDLKEVMADQAPDRVVVFGDVDSTLASALAASEMRIRLAHIEAGLRSFDLSMPEENNRILVDQLSDELYITEQSARVNLLAEGIREERIFFPGNLMIDSWERFSEDREKNEGGYILWTVHRPSNTDRKEALEKVICLLTVATTFFPVKWPCHPRTKKAITGFELYDQLLRLCQQGRLELTEPMGYREFSRCLEGASLVLTDSGGVQEEACVAGVPCITLRHHTERPVTVDIGANHILGIRDKDRLHDLIKRKLERKASWPRPPLWDGRASERIVAQLIRTSCARDTGSIKKPLSEPGLSR